jgi:hypothetical protein
MTIPELLGKTTDELEQLSSDERKAYLAPCLKYSRPERRETSSLPSVKAKLFSPEETAKKLLEKYGVKI